MNCAHDVYDPQFAGYDVDVDVATELEAALDTVTETVGGAELAKDDAASDADCTDNGAELIADARILLAAEPEADCTALAEPGPLLSADAVLNIADADCIVDCCELRIAEIDGS